MRIIKSASAKATHDARQVTQTYTPASAWPFWAQALKMVAKTEDKGIGDVIARTIGKENSEAFKAWYIKVFGKACGCNGRQARWNRQYPLP